MAIIKAINSKASIAKGINYITKEEKTEEKLINGINCNPETAIDEMKATKEIYSKATGRQYYHFIQSFNPMDRVDPEKAHKIGLEWLERNNKFKGHEIVMATHKDKDHIHNHFIINSVNFETGYKLHTNKKEYQQMKDLSNELSREYGLTVPEKSQEKGKFTTFNQNKYYAVKRHIEGKAKSYVIETMGAVDQAKANSKSRKEFIETMEKLGYQTNWKDNHKHITFINQENTKQRVRLENLRKTFKDENLTKGGLSDEFERNQRTSQERTVNWKSIEGDLRREGTGIDKQDQGDRLSEQPGHGIVDEIQRKVRDVKERTDRATGETKQTDQPIQDHNRGHDQVQPTIESEHRKGDWEMER